MNLEDVTLLASKEPILSKKESELCYKNAFSFDQMNSQYSTFDEPLELELERPGGWYQGCLF